MKLKSLILFVLTISSYFLLEATKAIEYTGTKSIQNAHLAGSWYPGNKIELEKDLLYYFSLAGKHFKIINNEISGNINGDIIGDNVTAIIVPHAGHYFSGLCAATAYQAIKKTSFERVIIIGPSHSEYFDGIALPDYDIYRTPMGDIPVDKKAVSSLLDKSSLFKVIPGVHQKEHSIEIQLPFLQFCLSNFSIVPLIVGNLQQQDFKTVSQAIGELINEAPINDNKNGTSKKTLIIVSSDFIHYGPQFDYTPLFDNVEKFDHMAIQAILDKSYPQFYSVIKKTGATICGKDPIKILLKIIEMGFFGQPGQIECQLTSYYNSAQLEQSRSEKKSTKIETSHNDKNSTQIDVSKLSQAQVVPAKSSVSYASLICTSKMTPQEERILLTLARNSITKELFPEKILNNNLSDNFKIPSNLKKVAGAFVTLKTKNGDLRGCIGKIITEEPLHKAIPEIALSSAFHDSRFSPLQKNELANITISITILTPPHYVTSYNDIVIGKHGIILEKTVNGRTKSAVFLPQVAGEQGWDLAETLENLSQKAGLAKDAWKSECKFKVFEGFEFSE